MNASWPSFSTIVDQSLATRRLTEILLGGFATLATYFPDRFDWQHKSPADVGMNPALVNEDPYGQGWLMKIKLTNADQFSLVETKLEQFKDIADSSLGISL